MSVERIDVPGDETGPLSPEQQQEMGQQPMSPEEVPEDGFPVPGYGEDGEVDVENLAAAYMELESGMALSHKILRKPAASPKKSRPRGGRDC